MGLSDGVHSRGVADRHHVSETVATRIEVSHCPGFDGHIHVVLRDNRGLDAVANMVGTLKALWCPTRRSMGFQPVTKGPDGGVDRCPSGNGKNIASRQNPIFTDFFNAHSLHA